jgi:hypothetical protein
MPTPIDKVLYAKVKKDADDVYDKPSAYKSGYIVKKYKLLGGKYLNDGKEKNLARWYKEKWRDVGGKSYPVYRPTKRINKNTPLTYNELDKIHLKNQIMLKQLYREHKNLPPFK